MTSGIMNSTQYEYITSQQNNLESPNASMHRVRQRRSWVPIYTNYEGDNFDIGGDDDGDVAIDDEDGTSPHAKGVSVAMLEGKTGPHYVGRKLGHVVGPPVASRLSLALRCLLLMQNFLSKIFKSILLC
jgi:hypothetical protein